MYKEISDINVMYVSSTNGPQGAKQAFFELESKLPTLKQRRFYGVQIGTPESGEYRACVKQSDEDNPLEMNLKTWTIPGGKYDSEKLRNWENNIELISETFNEMFERNSVDVTRPTIEFYRSQKELILMVPIK